MKSYHGKSRSIEQAQKADRNAPTLAPETEYCLPGSRFARLMMLVRNGASDELIRRKIRGIDRLTIRVARKIAAEQEGRKSRTSVPHGSLRKRMFELYDSGLSLEEAQRATGCSTSIAYQYRREWRQEGRGDNAGCA